MSFLFQPWRGLQAALFDSNRITGFGLQLAFLPLLAILASAQVSAQSFDSGFEDGLAGWDIDSAVEPVAVVGAEGAAEHPIYAELGVEVVPHLGDAMGRLRSPKSRNEQQDRGVSRISQTFTASSNTVAVALWLFSLDHRGDDILRISLTNNDPVTGGPIISANEFAFDNGSLNTTCTTPCEALIDTGKRQDVIDTGWQTLRFTDLDPGTEYTLSIELEAGQNESLGSWLYIDGVNQPPSPEINYNPIEPVEGDYVVFDCLDSVDPEGSDLSCIWDITAGGRETVLVGPSVVYWAPDSGPIDVTLTVSDGEESAIIPSTSVYITELDPRVNALDVEVLPGGSVELVCRYADPGVGPDDTHGVSFSVPVDPFDIIWEAAPALSTGIARAIYHDVDGKSIENATCTVGGEIAEFDITVLTGDEIDKLGDQNTSSTQSAPEVNADQSILGRLLTPDNIAVYRLLDAGGSEFPPGAEVVVTAEFPVDYDIVVLSGSADPAAKPWASAPFVNAPFVNAPFVNVPFVNAPFVNAPFVNAPFVNAPFVNAPFVNAPFVNAPFVNAPFVNAPFVNAPLTKSLWIEPGFEFVHFPLSLLAGAPDGSNISGADIAPGDLGALSYGALADEPVFLKGLSAEFTNPEQLLVKVGPGEDGLFLAVVPQAGSFSTAPFSIQVEASIPRPTKDLLVDACSKESGEELVVGGKTFVVNELRSGGSETLIVTQKERLMATFGMDEDAWDAWMDNPDPALPDMMDFFTMVDATVISLPSAIFDPADLNPCDVQAQNAVAQSIKQIIDGKDSEGNDVGVKYRTAATKYVQIMGSIDIIPPFYVPDETQTGNEVLFSSDLMVEPATPLAAAVSQGFMLTDAFYVDNDPQPFNGRKLYLEDISVSRMVETPGEMLANAQRFVENYGKINLVSTQSTGYDFFIDGTKEINRILTEDFPVNNNMTRNDDTWDASYLRCAYFGVGEGCEKPISEVNAVNAHMSYNGALTAKGFNCEYLPPDKRPDGLDCSGATDPLGEVVRSTESAGMYDNPEGLLAINGITFSIGCHSGLSVPDAWALPVELGLPLNPARDWVQELGTWVGSWNFAYGDTDVADRGTEGILPLVMANFAKGMPLGEALYRAKWQYGAGLFEFGVYDEKSLVGLGLFGMPQATLEGAGGGGNASLAFAATTTSTPASATGETLTINYIEEAIEGQAGGSINLHSNDKGIWYSIGDPPQAQAIVGRPLLPVVKLFEGREQSASRKGTIHGVALRGGTYTTYLNQDPVFPAQTHDLVTSIDEPQLCVDTLSPSLLASANRFDSPGGTLESVIVQTGQFQCTNGEDNNSPDPYFVEGDFRIWNALDLELMHPIELAFESDQQPPEVLRQDLLGDPVTGVVNATLDARDDSGIREIIALVYRDDDGQPGGTGTATSYSVTERNQEGVYELVLPDAFDNLMSFQYIDNAGEITAKTLKGALLRAIEVAIRTSFISLQGDTQIVVEIGDFMKLDSPYLTIDFGDDSQPLVIDFADPAQSTLYTLIPNEEDYSATVVIPYDYSELDQPSFTISVEVRASGALGSDEKTISACSDPIDLDEELSSADIVECSVTSDGTRLTMGMTLAGPVSADIQYRLILPQNNTQIKYSAGEVTGPTKLKPTATDDGDKTITFELDAKRLPWDGVSPIQFLFETQDGVSGGAGQGFVDTTDVKVYVQ